MTHMRDIEMPARDLIDSPVDYFPKSDWEAEKAEPIAGYVAVFVGAAALTWGVIIGLFFCAWWRDGWW